MAHPSYRLNWRTSGRKSVTSPADGRTELAERTREQAFATMLHQAHRTGANAVIGIRYDANEIMSGVTEVLCYGTAVRVEPVDP